MIRTEEELNQRRFEMEWGDKISWQEFKDMIHKYESLRPAQVIARLGMTKQSYYKWRKRVQA